MKHHSHQQVAKRLADGPREQRRNGPTQQPNYNAFRDHHQPNDARRRAQRPHHAHFTTPFKHVEAHRSHQTQATNTSNDHRRHDQKHVNHQHVLIERKPALCRS